MAKDVKGKSGLAQYVGQTLLLGACLALPAYAQSLPSVSITDGLARELDALMGESEKYAQPVSLRDYHQRFERAKAQFAAKAYQQTITTLLPILHSLRSTDSQIGAEGLYLIAESLFQVGDDQIASEYFVDLLKTQTGIARLSTLKRLIELSDQLQRYEELEGYYAEFEQLTSSIPQQMRYLHGKALFLQGHDRRAQEELLPIKVAGDYAFRSQYIMAASLIRERKFTKAKNYFDKIINAEVRSITDRKIKDLAIMAKARLQYTLDEIRDAVLTYEALPLDSPFVAEMFYELAMAYVRYGDLIRTGHQSIEDDEARETLALEIYRNAIADLQKLLVMDKNAGRDPKIKLLFADLLVRVGKQERASQFYQDLVSSFSTILPALDELEKQPENFINALFNNAKNNVPVSALLWASHRDEVMKGRNLFDKIQRAKSELKQLREQYASFLHALPENTVRNETHLKQILAQLYVIQAQILNLKKEEVAFYFAKAVDQRGAGGKLRVQFTNDLRLPYVVQSVKCTLNGLEVCNLSSGVSETIYWPLKSGQHEFVGTVEYQVRGAAIFDVLKYKLVVSKQFSGDLNQIQDMKVTLKNADDATKKPVLDLEVDSIPMSIQLTLAQWEQMSELDEKLGQLDRQWQRRESGSLEQHQEMQTLYQEYYEKLSNQQTVLREILNLREASLLDGLSERSFSAIATAFDQLNKEFETADSFVRQRIQHLDVLEKRLKSMESEFQPVMVEVVRKASPSWTKKVSWLLASAENGLVGDFLQKKYDVGQRIQQVEKIRASELAQLEKEFNLARGGKTP